MKSHRTVRLNQFVIDSMGETFPDIRDAGQENCLVLIAGIGAQDVLVPIVGFGAIFQQMAVTIARLQRFLRLHPREFPLQIVDKGLLGIGLDDVRSNADDMVVAQAIGWGEQAHEPDLSRAASKAGRNVAGCGFLCADLS